MEYKQVEKHKEILRAQYGKLFQLFLTIEFTKKDNYYIVESKKFKIRMESTNDSLESAKKEFDEVFDTVIKNLINSKTLFKVFKYLGIKQQPISKIIKEKNEELVSSNKKNIVEIDNDEVMKTPFITFNRIEPSLTWRPQI